MSESKHTPGPWAFFHDQYGSYLATHHRGRHVVLGARNTHLEVNRDGILEKLHDFPEHPDLDLIAAAPEMLRALEAVISECENIGNNGDIRVLTEIVDLVMQTIAEAKGEPPCSNPPA